MCWWVPWDEPQQGQQTDSTGSCQPQVVAPELISRQVLLTSRMERGPRLLPFLHSPPAKVSHSSTGETTLVAQSLLPDAIKGPWGSTHPH